MELRFVSLKASWRDFCLVIQLESSTNSHCCDPGSLFHAVMYASDCVLHKTVAKMLVFKPRTKDELVDGISKFWETVTVEKCNRYIP